MVRLLSSTRDMHFTILLPVSLALHSYLCKWTSSHFFEWIIYVTLFISHETEHNGAEESFLSIERLHHHQYSACGQSIDRSILCHLRHLKILPYELFLVIFINSATVMVFLVVWYFGICLSFNRFPGIQFTKRFTIANSGTLHSPSTLWAHLSGPWRCWSEKWHSRMHISGYIFQPKRKN